jgi:hypothetical protein
MHGTGVKITL